MKEIFSNGTRISTLDEVLNGFKKLDIEKKIKDKNDLIEYLNELKKKYEKLLLECDELIIKAKELK